MPFLTPSVGTYVTHRLVLHIPSLLLPYFTGALDELTHEENWEQFGDLTPAQMAAGFIVVLNSIVDTID